MGAGVSADRFDRLDEILAAINGKLDKLERLLDALHTLRRLTPGRCRIGFCQLDAGHDGDHVNWDPARGTAVVVPASERTERF